MTGAAEGSSGSAPKLYAELAEWWPLLSAPADYEEEAGFYRGLLEEACAPTTVLELGSGGGNNACHMKGHFELCLVDCAPGMLAVSRALNPECEHRQGDMRSVRLGHVFDAVFVHDALSYITSAADLARTLETVFVHCKSGGAALLAPDQFSETFEAGVSTGGHDGGGRALRYMEWSHPPAPNACTFEIDYAFLLREADGSTRSAHDRHQLGLFPRDRWLELCRAAGFEVQIRTVVHSEFAPRETELILCQRPPGAN